MTMADCCSSKSSEAPKKKMHRCPRNGIEYHELAVRTIKHHIKRAWEWEPGNRRYFFCEDPDCDVVYFADDDSVILTSQLRTRIGIKTTDDDALVCYCFGISKADAQSDATLRAYVLEQTKNGECSCDTRNPSGRCCLKDFPRPKSS